MSVLEKSKKTAEQDWHRADILAETVLDKSYPKMERLVANAIGVPPEIIWAGRFAERNRRPTLQQKY